MQILDYSLFNSGKRQQRFIHVLAAANTKPTVKSEFYSIKSRVCRLAGQQDGCEYQRIDHKCWDCDGPHDASDYDYCYRCDGTGIYSTSFVALQRWRVGSVVFHEPIGRVLPNEIPNSVALIKGLIQHRRCSWSDIANAAIGRLCDESYYWTCLRVYYPERMRRMVVGVERLINWIQG